MKPHEFGSRLGIVTSASNGYGRWLMEWAESIVALDHRPAFVGIFTHGDSDAYDQAQRASAYLHDRGYRVRASHEPHEVDLGTARNRAVGLVADECEWVMHLDADDCLLREAIGEAAQLADEADVIVLGYERFGDLHAAEPNPRMTFSDHDGADGPPPRNYTGVAPFRVSLWRLRPYRVGMLGAWDSALWIDFARLGARFRATPVPAFRYRARAESVYNVRRRSRSWARECVRAEIDGLRRGDEGVTVIIPYRPDGQSEHRRASFEFVKAWYRTMFPEWQVCSGDNPGVDWRKGAAIAEALRWASGRVLVIADADCIVSRAALLVATSAVASGNAPWVVPHKYVYRLNDADSRRFIEDGPRSDVRGEVAGKTVRPPYVGYAGGGILVVRRDRYEATGGIPRDFIGWGGEDESLAVILDTFVGKHARLDDDLIHLWHHEQGGRMRGRQWQQNMELARRIKQAGRDPDELWAVLRGGARKAPRSRRKYGIAGDAPPPSLRSCAKCGRKLDRCVCADRITTREIRAAVHAPVLGVSRELDEWLEEQWAAFRERLIEKVAHIYGGGS